MSGCTINAAGKNRPANFLGFAVFLNVDRRAGNEVANRLGKFQANVRRQIHILGAVARRNVDDRRRLR